MADGWQEGITAVAVVTCVCGVVLRVNTRPVDPERDAGGLGAVRLWRFVFFALCRVSVSDVLGKRCLLSFTAHVHAHAQSCFDVPLMFVLLRFLVS